MIYTTITTVGDGKHTIFLCCLFCPHRETKINRFPCRFVFDSQVVNLFALFHVLNSGNDFGHDFEVTKNEIIDLNVIFKEVKPKMASLRYISGALAEEHVTFPRIFAVFKLTSSVCPHIDALSIVRYVGGQTSWVLSALVQ